MHRNFLMGLGRPIRFPTRALLALDKRSNKRTRNGTHACMESSKPDFDLSHLIKQTVLTSSIRSDASRKLKMKGGKQDKKRRARTKIVDEDSDEDPLPAQAKGSGRRKKIVDDSDDDVWPPRTSPRKKTMSSRYDSGMEDMMADELAGSPNLGAQPGSLDENNGQALLSALSSPPRQQAAPVANMSTFALPVQDPYSSSSEDSLFHEPGSKSKKKKTKTSRVPTTNSDHTSARVEETGQGKKQTKMKAQRKSSGISRPRKTSQQTFTPLARNQGGRTIRGKERMSLSEDKNQEEEQEEHEDEEEQLEPRKEGKKRVDFYCLKDDQRTDIYEYVLIHGEGVKIPTEAPYIREPALLAVSKQVRKEALPIFYTESTFDSRFVGDICAWLDCLDLIRLNMLRWVNLETTMPAGFVLPSLRKMNKRVEDGLKPSAVAVRVVLENEEFDAHKTDITQWDGKDWAMVSLEDVTLYDNLDGGWETLHTNRLKILRSVTRREVAEPMEGVEPSVLAEIEDDDETYVESSDDDD